MSSEKMTKFKGIHFIMRGSSKLLLISIFSTLFYFANAKNIQSSQESKESDRGNSTEVIPAIFVLEKKSTERVPSKLIKPSPEDPHLNFLEQNSTASNSTIRKRENIIGPENPYEYIVDIEPFGTEPLTSEEYQRRRRQLFREDIPHHRPLSGNVYANHYGYPHPGRWTGRDFPNGPMTNMVAHSDEIHGVRNNNHHLHEHENENLDLEEHNHYTPHNHNDIGGHHPPVHHHQPVHQEPHHHQQIEINHEDLKNHHHHQTNEVVHNYPVEYGHEINLHEGIGIDGLVGVGKDIHQHFHHHIEKPRYVVGSGYNVGEPHGHHVEVHQEHVEEVRPVYGPPPKPIHHHPVHHGGGGHGHIHKPYKPFSIVPIPIPIPHYHLPKYPKKAKRPKFTHYVYHHRHPFKAYWPKFKGGLYGGSRGLKGSFLWYG